jgi:hypothetical protein
MKLGKLIRTGGLALALAAGALASGCDDDDPATGKDGSVTTDGGSDAGKADTATTPDAGKADATPDAGAPDADTTSDGGESDAGSDASAD